MATLLTPTGAPSVFGGVGKLEFAPTNAPDDPFPTYVDITPYLRTEQTAVTITRGRQTELDTIQPSQLTAILDNTDNRFTFGNIAGPYGANWTTAKKVRYSETIGQRTFVLFTGWIEYPDIDSWQPIGYQEVSLTCTDRLTRLGRGQPFVSTLTEHIRFNASTALRAWWPLNDAVGSSLVAGVGPIQQVTNYNDVVVNNQLLWANRPGPPGDDVSYVQYNPTAAVIANNYIGKPRLTRRDVNVPFTAGQVVAILGWVYVPVNTTAFGANGPYQILVSHANNFLNPTFTFRGDVGTGWTFQVTTNSGSTSAIVPAIKTDGWSCVGMFFDVSSGTATLRVDGQVATNSFGLGSGGALQEIALDGLVGHSWAQVQMYAGSPSQLGQAFFNAQYQMGLTGLEYQATGQRINTILDYAGVPAGDRAVDPGVSYMRKATLAGQTPQTALQNAVTTERGRGFAAGDGRYVFHDRARVLNV